jgi:integrase
VMSKAIADEKSGRLNPARYDDHLKERVGPRVVSKAKLAEKGMKKGKTNVNSLSYEKAPSIFQRLWNGKGMTTACMAFLMATGARSDEARCARWSEIDFTNKVWFIDAVRMKASEDHAVPLCDELVDLLSKLKEVAAPDAEFIFPGAGGKALDPKAMDKKLCLTKHGGFGLRGEACMHGMRTTFTTWAQEQYINGVRRWDDAAITMSIAHAHGTRADRAYMRSPQMQARREMLAEYLVYLMRPVNDNVVPMKRKEAA